MSKVDKYVANEFEGIIKETREYRAFELGTAHGLFQLYKHVVKEESVEYAKETFKTFINGKEAYSKYFRKLIEIDEESRENISLQI
jgi:hypothetical protein